MPRRLASFSSFFRYSCWVPLSIFSKTGSSARICPLRSAWRSSFSMSSTANSRREVNSRPKAWAQSAVSETKRSLRHTPAIPSMMAQRRAAGNSSSSRRASTVTD